MKRTSVLALSAALALSACASSPGDRIARCPTENGRWQRTKDIPENADELRRMADSTTFDQRSGDWTAESWFRTSTGEIMLCRERPLEHEWWQFRQTADGPELIGHNGLDI